MPRVRHSAKVPLAVILAATLAACGSAGGAVQGGADLFEAGPAPIPDSGPPVDAGSGTTWTDLYRDFFGHVQGGPGCSGTGSCHKSADQGGGSTWVCGDTQDSCWRGLTTANPPIIDTKDPESSVLFLVALRTKAGGNMPLAPASYVFSDGAISRIRTWMAAGAQNN